MSLFGYYLTIQEFTRGVVRDLSCGREKNRAWSITAAKYLFLSKDISSTRKRDLDSRAADLVKLSPAPRCSLSNRAYMSVII